MGEVGVKSGGHQPHERPAGVRYGDVPVIDAQDSVGGKRRERIECSGEGGIVQL